MKSNYIISVLLAIVILSCDKKEENPAEISVKTITINASDDKTWMYFSFENDTVINITDPINSLDWDIAFMRYKIKTNSGKSGKGNAGVYSTNQTDNDGFNIVKSVVIDSTFVVDDTVTVYGYNPVNPSQPTISRIVLNPILYQWYNREDTPNGTMIVSKKIVYVFRSAKGKYAKFFITNYYNDEGKSGYYTIKYFYQPNGSTSLE